MEEIKLDIIKNLSETYCKRNNLNGELSKQYNLQ